MIFEMISGPRALSLGIEAKRLLITTDMKISEIAHVLGYQNANYFTNLFTNTMGESPTQYKKNERAERVDLLET